MCIYGMSSCITRLFALMFVSEKKEQHHPHIYLSTVVVGLVLWLFALFLLCQYFIHSLVVAFNVCGWMEQKSHLTSRSTPPTLYVVSGLWSSPLISGLTIC